MIRKYKPKDRKAVEDIHYETAFLGKSFSEITVNKNYWSKEIKYYLEKEPQSSFVVEENGKVVGYLCGCLDDKNYKDKFMTKTILNGLKLPFMKKEERGWHINMLQFLWRVITGKSQELIFETPKNAGHMHINLLPETRGKGYGSQLINKFVEYAKENGVKKIHADGFQTRLNPNLNFWKQNGFKQSCVVKTSLWQKYYPNEDIKLCCYTKKIQ